MCPTERRRRTVRRCHAAATQGGDSTPSAHRCHRVSQKSRKVTRSRSAQILGDNDKPMSAPVHSSVSGIVTAVDFMLWAGGVQVSSVEIETDGKQEVPPDVAPPVIENKQDFLKRSGTAVWSVLGERASRPRQTQSSRRQAHRHPDHQRGGMRTLHHQRLPGDSGKRAHCAGRDPVGPAAFGSSPVSDRRRRQQARGDPGPQAPLRTLQEHHRGPAPDEVSARRGKKC